MQPPPPPCKGEADAARPQRPTVVTTAEVGVGPDEPMESGESSDEDGGSPVPRSATRTTQGVGTDDGPHDGDDDGDGGGRGGAGTGSGGVAGAGTGPTMPIPKRRRVTRACDECRKKKIKCDGRLPCTHCHVYSYGKSMVFSFGCCVGHHGLQDGPPFPLPQTPRSDRKSWHWPVRYLASTE